jgi:uncharacterized protein YcfL
MNKIAAILSIMLICSCGSVHKVRKSEAISEIMDSSQVVSVTEKETLQEVISRVDVRYDSVVSNSQETTLEFEVTIYDNSKTDSLGKAPIAAVVKGIKRTTEAGKESKGIQVLTVMDSSYKTKEKDSLLVTQTMYERKEQTSNVETERSAPGPWVAWTLLGIFIAFAVVVFLIFLKHKILK